jgi:CRP/FNR family transcriptional regulator
MRFHGGGKMQTVMTTNQLNAHRTVPPTTGGFIETLAPAAKKDFSSLLNTSTYPPNMVLFQEKELPQYVYLVLDGEVKLSMNSSEGKRLILRIVRKGEIVGLASALSGHSYDMTAETLHPAKLAPISRRDFLNFLARHPEVYQTVTEMISQHFTMACEQLRTVALSPSAPRKLARLLLDWSERGQDTEAGTRFRFSLTHGEVGEFIGASRETVTRTLSVFKSRRLVMFNGSTLTIPNKSALEQYALD